MMVMVAAGRFEPDEGADCWRAVLEPDDHDRLTQLDKLGQGQAAIGGGAGGVTVVPAKLVSTDRIDDFLVCGQFALCCLGRHLVLAESHSTSSFRLLRQ